MVMEESVMHPHHETHSPSGGDAPNANAGSNVYLVGLEFVRQYYTVLNQGPLYLHRFYSDDSSFVHGASARDSKVAYGQQEIHKRIQSLNFHNCHAKIRQVDSHETVGNGVVIQVTGELSNNGQPMRRFMQTFVLAPQSPKRYYVRNDIFHYQDEVFCDEEQDAGDASGEPGLENEEGEGEENDHESIPVVEMNGGSDIVSQEVTATSTVEVSVKTPSSPRSAGTPKAEMVEPVVSEPPAPVPEPVVTVSADGPTMVDGATSTEPASSAPSSEEEAPAASPTTVTAPTFVPKTYANLFKAPAVPTSKPAAPPAKVAPPSGKGTNGPGAGSPGNNQLGTNNNDITTSPPQVSPQTASAAVKGLPPKNPRGPGGNGNGGYRSNDKDSRDRRERLTSRSSTTLNDDSGSVDGDRRRPVHTYPDANQLFVGNLPHFVTIQDMKEIFQQFGDVAEVKIQKPTPKSGGAKVPYFCFVVFEDAASAQSAIERKNEIFMKMNGGAHRRLNVEPKRSQRGRLDGDHGDAPYNRMDSSSPGGGRPSEGGPRGSRTFRGSNRGGGEGGHGGRGGGNMNSNRGGGSRGGHANKPATNARH